MYYSYFIKIFSYFGNNLMVYNLKIRNNILIFCYTVNQMKKENQQEYISKDTAQEMIEKALRRHNRRSTIISSILGWILIGGYSFGLFHVVQNT